MLLRELRAFERSTGRCPARLRCVPRNGILKSPFFAKKRNWYGRRERMAGMSIRLWWFDTKT
jgi:hypothetical protein